MTVGTNPTRFLDTVFSRNLDGSVTTVFHKHGKLPAFLNSQIPRKYKWNNIRGDFHYAFKNASDFDVEVQAITRKNLEIGYPIGFIKSLISNFKNSKEEEQPIIPQWLFDQRRFYLSCLIVPAMKEMLSVLLRKSKVLPMEN